MSRAAALPVLFAALALSLPAAAERTITIDGGDGSGCSSVNMHFGDRITARGEETITLSRRDAKGLVLEGSRNGGIIVRGADVGEFKVTACTAAAGDDDASARAVLSRIVLRSSGGRVTIEGPEGEHWTGFLIVTAPKDADFSAEGSNGPVSLTSLAGTLSVKAANGPVSLSNLTGSVDVEAANGPVSLKGSSGDIRIHAVNGPLTIALTGTRWEGKGLEADAKNGPLTLKVPDGFSTGVRVETSSHSPFSCRAAACEGARRQNGNRTRLFEIGNENATVRISTSNGPVSIVDANRS
jgi:Putative adhesin